MVPAVDVFFAYSHKDEPFRAELATHLKILERTGAIRGWCDRAIGAGEEWRSVIQGNLEKAHVILLLVSADFLASDFCYEVEMMRALARHRAGATTVIPIIVRDCRWSSAPFALLQALPREAKPVTSWTNRDEAWTSVVDGIATVAARIAEPSAAAPNIVAEEGPTRASVELDENDQLSILESWLRREAPSAKRLIAFAEVDAQLELPEGSTARHVEKAATSLGYDVDRRGAKTIMLKRRSPTPRPPPRDRGWSPGRDGFGGF